MTQRTMMRRWSFRLAAAIGLPLLLLLVVEGALRVGGYGVDTSYVHRVRDQGRTWLRNNPHFYELFFPEHLLPAALPFSLAHPKPDEAVRVVLLGGSAAMGIPEPAYGMGPALEEMLRHRHPGARIEVLNLANTAINSHVVREIARGSLALAPDLFVVYLGNNEVVGPYGAGTVFTRGAPALPAVRAGIAVRRTRVGQLLQEVAGALGRGARETPRHWRGMEMFLEQQVPADHPRLQTVRDHFRANLEAICTMAAENGIPVVLATVGVNLRHCAPFASESDPGLGEFAQGEQERLQKEAGVALGAGDLETTRDLYAEALQIDPGHADLHYRTGRLALGAGDEADAREHLEAARELDTLRFRADRSINEIIHGVGRRFADRGVILTAVAESLRTASPAGLPGREFLWEHVHFDLPGNHLVARCLVPAVESGLGPRLERPVNETPLGVEELAVRLAYTPWNRSRLTQQVGTLLQRPPFSGQSDHAEQMARLEREFQRLQPLIEPDSLGRYWSWHERSVQRDPGSWIRAYRAAAFLMDALGQPATSEPLWRSIVDHLPHFPAARNELARALAAQNEVEEAVREVERSLDLDPYQPEMLGNLATLRLRQGDREGAREALRRALEVDPEEESLRQRLEELEG